jgi:hypothetical protein
MFHPPTTATGTIPMWLGSDTSNSVTYHFAMVGKDPSVPKTGSTTITTKLLPIVFTGSTSSASYVFDPESNDACSPQNTAALKMVQVSPLIKPNNLLLNGVSLGTYQFGSQFQRANFSTYTIKSASNASPASPNYDISLSAIVVNAEESIKQRIAIGATTPSPNPLP